MDILATYTIVADKVPGIITIKKKSEEYVPIYEISLPRISIGTEAVLDAIKLKMIKSVKIRISEILDPKAVEDIKKRFMESALVLLEEQLPRITDAEKGALAGYLVHEMLGLGKMEVLLKDDFLEEIVINSSSEPLWVFHKRFGWVKSNIYVPTEEQIYNYSSIIGRKVGRQITMLNPLMDAHLTTGDRVNATIFPISARGNTITIRKFRREPWTMVNFIEPSNKTLSVEIASLIWLCMQYELNILFSGGTASGKTSILNSALAFIPPNQRIISIEDTRELKLPEFLHWIPLTTRTPNPEGKGEVNMLDLLVNSLRMRPDRVILGEIRRQNEAEVLFEAMHTGHSVYATLHADRAEQVITRLTNPPIDLPPSLLESLHLVVVQFRHRRLGIRRTFQVGEVIPTEKDGRLGVRIDLLYRWSPKHDSMEKVNKSRRIFDEVGLHTGMSDSEIEKDMDEKGKILNWMLQHQIVTVNTVGKVIADYYHDRDALLKIIHSNKGPQEILGENLMKELKEKQVL